jgi:methionyl-tRNA formyltransferase
MRVLYMGQKALGELCFKYLWTTEIEVIGIISNARKDTWWKSRWLYEFAERKNIIFLQNESRNDSGVRKLIADEKIDTIISVQNPWILPNFILDAVGRRAFNLHNAKLPNYKGHNVINHEILNGEKIHTSTIHQMIVEPDMGDVIFTENIPILPNDTAKSLYEKALSSGVSVFTKLIDFLRTGETLPHIPIRGMGKFYPRNSIDSLREIKNINDPEEVDKKARAFYFPPFEPAYFRTLGKKFYVTPRYDYE